MKLSFFIHGRPIPKQSARIGKHGGYQPKRIQEYGEKVRMYCAKAVSEGDWKVSERPVMVTLLFCFPWPGGTKKALIEDRLPRIKRPDVDNLSKACLDGMDVLWVDDAQVSHLVARKLNVPRGQEGVQVEVCYVE
tara:strand:+ start:2085 stop:2489 length:405 start_codon:yes stop_codon:yes gene_type:complete